MCRKRSDVRDQFWNRLRRSRKTIWAACKCRVGGRRITNRCGLDSRRIRKGRGNRLLAIWIHSFASRLTSATLVALPCMSLVPLAPFSSTASTIHFPVVRPDRCARSQNLFAQYLSFCCFRQLGKQANNLQREFLRALPEIFFCRLHPS